MTNSYGENQKIQNALILSKHKKMMDLYKLLKDENGMQYKSITDLSMNIKPYQTQEEIERQKLIKKGVSVTQENKIEQKSTGITALLFNDTFLKTSYNPNKSAETKARIIHISVS